MYFERKNTKIISKKVKRGQIEFILLKIIDIKF